MYPEPINVPAPECKNVVQLISGGAPANDGEFPHYALLGYNKSGTSDEYDFRCGGTLISDQHVLTAAHCFKLQLLSFVRLGENDITVKSKQEYDVPIEGFLKHPENRFSKVYHDIVLVKLKYQVNFTKSIRPACLSDTENRNITKYIATGFGMTENNENSETMMKVALEKFPEDDCLARVKHLESRYGLGILPGQMCVGSNTVGRDTCVGDSGGALQTVTNPSTCTFHVVGVVSTGLKGCGIGKARAVYTKVPYYLDWIEEIVWGAKMNSAYEKILVPK
ncbi:hypothetical protein ZHAS_00005429 [Anopheles sinensis]|uniref:Peptidase S1 domain-containing protein n=1 Tax=Anopheles sinensis TaxID=74873 RepID=A0A084VJJ5_ANOSI|nr:hypothetical protein ZHAS_00005429 [Anopheles sinensis]